MSVKKPAFSVVVPCYNAGRFIFAALESIKEQTFRDFEAVIVNDGSTDDSLQIIDRFPGDFPLRVVTQANGGLGAARNRAIRESLGTYVAFLDADDCWDANKLERVHEVVARESVDLICHDERFVRDGREVRRVAYGPHRTYLDLLFKGNCLSPSAVSVRRERLIQVGGFTEDRRIHGVEDYDLWMRLASAGASFCYLHEVLGSYRLHDESLSSASDFNARELLLIESHFRLLDQSLPNIRRGIRRRRASYYASLGFKMLRKKELVAAARAYRTAMRLRPMAGVILKYAIAGPIAFAGQELYRVLSSFGRKRLVPRQ